MRASSTPRLTFDKDFHYSSKVCTGHWLSRRQNEQPPIQHKTLYTSVTREDYGPKFSTKLNPAILWDRIIASESSNFIPLAVSSDQVPYFQNFSSTHDLAFNHFPKMYKYWVPKTGYDYSLSYGNLTNYGLTDYKKYKWGCGVVDPRRNFLTQYRDHFEAPSSNDYKFKRFAIPRANSSKLPRSNLHTPSMKLRNMPMFIAPDVNLVIPPRCNQTRLWD